MTNTATDTAFITFTLGHTNPTAHILDAMSGYDSDLYRREIAAGNLDELVNEEWAHVWTQGDNTHASREAAQAHAETAHEGNFHIIEITKDDVREALTRAFGENA